MEKEVIVVLCVLFLCQSVYAYNGSYIDPEDVLSADEIPGRAVDYLVLTANQDEERLFLFADYGVLLLYVLIFFLPLILVKKYLDRRIK